MSLNTMARRMSLEVPGLSDLYAQTLLSEALGLIEDSHIWSFQLKESGWLTPGLLFPSGAGSSVGTVTFTPYSNLVIADSAATAQWVAYANSGQMPLFTSLQIRSPFYSLYNIIGFSNGNGGGYGVGGYGAGGYGFGSSGFASLTIDRPWMEPGGSGQTYMIYQAYFPVPVADFKRFRAVRDTTNNAPIDYWSKTQIDLAVEDPERTVFDDPTNVVPYETDQRQATSTPGVMLYELWPHPLSVLPYSFSYLRRGSGLVAPADTVPYPLTEECVLWRAKSAAYSYKEAQKGEQMQRGSGADFRFLAQEAMEQYKETLKPIKMRDDDLVNLYMAKFRRDLWEDGEPFATITGQLNVGR